MCRRFCFDTCLQFFWIYAKKWNFRAALCVTFNSLPNAAHRDWGAGGLCSSASSLARGVLQLLSLLTGVLAGVQRVCVLGRVGEVVPHCARCSLLPCLWGKHGKSFTKMGCCLVAEIQPWFVCLMHSMGAGEGPSPTQPFSGPWGQLGLGILGGCIYHLEVA